MVITLFWELQSLKAQQLENKVSSKTQCELQAKWQHKWNTVKVDSLQASFKYQKLLLILSFQNGVAAKFKSKIKCLLALAYKY